MDEDTVLKSAIDCYGKTAQVLKCIEELGELQWELLQSLEHTDYVGEDFIRTVSSLVSEVMDWARGNVEPSSLKFNPSASTTKAAKYELADVSIMVEQMGLEEMFGDFKKERGEKTERLKGRINDERASQSNSN